MSLNNSLKDYIFSYNLIRAQKEQFGTLAFMVLLTVNTLQMISVLTLIPAQESDLFSSTLNQTAGLFALPNLIEVFGIPTHDILFALIVLLGAYFVANLVCAFFVKKESQMRKYTWVMNPLPRGDLFYLYKKILFVPIVQLALTELLHMRNLEHSEHSEHSERSEECSTEWCEMPTLGVGVVVLMMALYLYCVFAFFTIPCSFEDEAQEESTNIVLELIKPFHIALVIALAVANINVFIVFAFWGTYWTVDLIDFLWNGRYTRPKIEHFSSILKGVEFAVFCMFLLPNALNSSDSNLSFVGFLICPLAIKVIYNLKLLTEKQIITEFSSTFQGIQSLHPLRVHKCLKSLLYEKKAKSTQNHESSSISLNVLTSINEDSKEMVEISTFENEGLFSQRHSEHENSQGQTIIDAVEKIYSVLSYDKKNKIKLDIILLWIIFLKDVKKSHVKAFTLLPQMQKSFPHSSLRKKLQVELLDYLIRQQITLQATEKSVTAEALFTFLGEVEKTKQAVETYLIKSFEFYILLQNQIVKAAGMKKQGSHLLSERVVILKKLKNLLIKNTTHTQTIQLFNFFIKEIIEDNIEGQFWEIENKRYRQLINESQSKKEKDWNMTLESFANSNDGLSTSHHVIVLSLDSGNSGQVLRISNRLLEILDFAEITPTSLNIDTLEVTFFNRKNMKWIKDQIMEGKDPFEAFAQEDRVIYLKNSNGKFLTFHFYPCLEIYEGVPAIVCYLRIFDEYNQKFLIFNPDKENKIIGVGRGFTWLDNQSLKDKKVQDYFSSFPSDCQQLTKVQIEGASFEWKGLSRCKTISTDKSSPLLDVNYPHHSRYTIDYVVEMPHAAVLKKRLGVLTIVHSLKKESIKTRQRLSEARDETPVTALENQFKKSCNLNSDFNSFSSQIGSHELAFESQDKYLVARMKSLSPTNEIKFEALTDSQVRFENNQNVDNDHAKAFHLQTHQMETSEGKEITKEAEKTVKKLQFAGIQHVKVDYNQVSNSESEAPIVNQKNLNREAAKKKPLDSGKRKPQTGYEGSTTSSRLGASSNYLRARINGKKTPNIIKIIYAFGIIIFGMTIVCTIVVYSILTTQYAKMSDFAAHATFPGYLKVASASIYEASEMQLAVNLMQFAPSNNILWTSSVLSILNKRIPSFVKNYGENLVNFNPESLTDNLHLNNYTIDFEELPELKLGGITDFYEATAIFMAFAQQMSLVPKYPTLFTTTLTDFMRFFSEPYANEMLDPIREVLVESAYDQYDYIMNLLNSILIVCALLITGLIFIFGFVFRKFERMETTALAKLCTVLPKEHLAKEIGKIVSVYESRLGPNPSLSSYMKYNSNWTNEKKKKSHGISQSARKIVQDHLSLQKVISMLLLVAFALSGSFVMTNTIFRSKTKVLLPFLEDLDKISNGISSYVTVLSVFLRFMNEIKNPNINETLPGLVATYQPVIADALQAHEEMILRFRDFASRILDTDITSIETKTRYQNNTNADFCWSRDQNGTTQNFNNICVTSLKNAPSRGLPDTAELVIKTVAELIQQFISSPTQQTANAILNSTDIYYFNYLTSLMTNSITWLASSEQIDISLYANSLEKDTNRLRIICLGYTCLMIVLVWVPIIIYLKKRFRSSRNIFLLFPIRLLRSNEHIKHLFKKW